MSLKKIIGTSVGGEQEESWITVSDLMAGLMVIFLFIAITYIRPITEIQTKIREIVVAWNDTEVQLYEALEAEFKDDLPRWDAELEQQTLTMRFRSPEVLFDSATAELKPKFKAILREFVPRYLLILRGFEESIQEVRIEGHTSSEWVGAETADEAYFQNMALSQARTRSVLEYSLMLDTVAPYKDLARALITANGLSSSQPILRDGNEDRFRSRRVEFRIRTNAKQQIVRVLETVQP